MKVLYSPTKCSGVPMSSLILLGFFLLKHAMLSHVLDVGYSSSRMSTNPKYRSSTTLFVSAEITATGVLFLFYSPTLLLPAMSLEAAILLLTSIIERKSPPRILLWTHLCCELTVAAFYFVIIKALLVWE